MPGVHVHMKPSTTILSEWLKEQRHAHQHCEPTVASREEHLPPDGIAVHFMLKTTRQLLQPLQTGGAALHLCPVRPSMERTLLPHSFQNVDMTKHQQYVVVRNERGQEMMDSISHRLEKTPTSSQGNRRPIVMQVWDVKAEKRLRRPMLAACIMERFPDKAAS
eukprot:1148771-Pelagomonas_calceolata.AAC.7